MNNTLFNGLKVLEWLAETGAHHAIKDVAAALELPNSHVHRLLQTLKEAGYVTQDKKRRYGVSLQVLMLSQACLKRLRLRDQLRPYLRQLAEKTNGSGFLSVPVHGRPLVVDVFHSMHTERDAMLSIGELMPLHSSASGRVCAVFQPPEVLAELLAACLWEAYTPRTITDPEAFRRSLERVRVEEVALIKGERAPGVDSAAAPVYDRGGELVAILGVALPWAQERGEGEYACVTGLMKEMARAASFALGAPLGVS